VDRRIPVAQASVERGGDRGEERIPLPWSLFGCMRNASRAGATILSDRIVAMPYEFTENPGSQKPKWQANEAACHHANTREQISLNSSILSRLNQQPGRPEFLDGWPAYCSFELRLPSCSHCSLRSNGSAP